MSLTNDRLALFDQMAGELNVAVISDILDQLGLRDQVMQATIHPIDPGGRQIVVGRAHTIRFAPQFEVPESPYTTVIAAIDALQPGDVGVMAAGGMEQSTFWGELFSNAAIARGARGMVMDGHHRDTRKILDLGFPVFSTGARPVDMAGRAQAVDFNRPIVCGGVRVSPGDIVFAEMDGIAVIPESVATEVVARAFSKVASEDLARDELRQGALLADVWQKYRVL